MVKGWADRLLDHGVEVLLDIYDLKGGHDKFAFMERMVTDQSVTHVLVMCDKVYAEKADARAAGVGVETQIISKEVYEKVEQSKFIPIACELDEHGKWYLPTFLKSRIGFNFSTPEAVNENWEQLVRLLFGKPLHVKPTVGKPPAYLLEDSTPSNPATAKFAMLKQAILNARPAVEMYRQDFLDACIEYADALRIRKQPIDANFGERVVSDCGKLRLVRNQVIDWVLLEAPINHAGKFPTVLISFLERLVEIKAKPKEVNPWSESWFDAHKVFVYETFLYVVAALLKVDAVEALHEVFTSHYLQPEGSRGNRGGDFASFSCFWTHSDALQFLAPDGKKLLCPAAELIKRQADRSDLPFESVMEAELLVVLMAFVSPSVSRWYPGTLLYARHVSFPFFVRAAQHRGFQRLAIITGFSDVELLRSAVSEGQKRLHVELWHDFWSAIQDFCQWLNLAKLDSIK